MNLSNYLACLFVVTLFLSSCGKPDLNTEVNESLQETWNVQTITQDNMDVFPTLYTAQSYTFVQDKDFKERGEVTVVSVPVGATGATTEEADYVISGAGATISWSSTPKAFTVVDTILTINYSNMTIKAVKEE